MAHFHSYLHGVEFVIRTDHVPLRWLKSLKNPEAQLWRWISYLEEYNYRVVPRPGRNHDNADSLSRQPCEVGCSHCSRRGVVSCQRVRVEGGPRETSQR